MTAFFLKTRTSTRPTTETRSLRPVRLPVLFTAKWRLQVGSPPDTITARRFCVISISAARFTAGHGQAACPLCCDMASSCWQDHKNPQVPHSCSSSSVRSLSLCSPYRSHNRLFPLPPSLYVHRQPCFALDRATLMNATLAARERSHPIRTGMPFFT